MRVAVEVTDEGTVRQFVPDVAAIDDLSIHLANNVDRAVVGDAVHNREACAGSFSRIHPAGALTMWCGYVLGRRGTGESRAVCPHTGIGGLNLLKLGVSQ
jgi:hypothetical protein